MRVRLAKTASQEPWKDTEEECAKCVKACAAYINDHFEVTELRLEFPQRVAKIIDAEGGRIKK